MQPVRPPHEKLAQKLHRQGIGAELLEITLYPIRRFIDQRKTPSYYDHVYLQGYTLVIRELNLRGRSATTAEAMLCSRMITENYNDLIFMDYLTTRRNKQLRGLHQTRKTKDTAGDAL